MGKKIILTVIAVILFASVNVSGIITSKASQTLVNRQIAIPYDVPQIQQDFGKKDTKSFSCPSYPKPIKNLILPSYYKSDDETKSQVNSKKYEQHQEMRAPLRNFENTLLKMTNRYVASNPARIDIAKCAQNWLYSWAKKDALLGKTNKTGEHLQKWTLSVVANAYYQIKNDNSLSTHKNKKIEKWLKKYAYSVKETYSQNTQLNSRQNNHLYWAAWAVGFTGALLEDKSLFDWGVSKALYGVYQIQPNGVLPLELDRGSRAVNYHVFAAHPLVMMAELARINDAVNLYAENNKALEKLVNLSVQGVFNPKFFEKQTGLSQEVELLRNGSALAWLSVYKRYRTTKPVNDLIQAHKPMKQTRTGGNISLLYSGLPQKLDRIQPVEQNMPFFTND